MHCMFRTQTKRVRQTTPIPQTAQIPETALRVLLNKQYFNKNSE